MPPFGVETDDIIHLKDSYYILATSSHADDRTQVLKQDDVFAVFDRFGDIHPIGMTEQGIYYQSTRFVSRLDLRLNRKRPLILSSNIDKNNMFLSVHLTNPDILSKNDIKIPRGSIHLFRSKFLYQKTCYEQIRISSYARHSVDLDLSLTFHSDYADIFEVRGVKRKQRGQIHEPKMADNGVVLSYTGKDQIQRKTRIISSPSPNQMNQHKLFYHLHLNPNEPYDLFLEVHCQNEQLRNEGQSLHFQEAYQKYSQIVDQAGKQYCEILTTNSGFNEWIHRSLSDIQMMTTQTKYGLYPYAGVPWYCNVFGRDALITALELLWLRPELAKGTLNYLAQTQAKESNSEQDAEPGKIIHEIRYGEMANLNEIPFGHYYGSIDATPLFLILAGEYLQRTNDITFIQSLWKNIEAALQWIDESGDLDGDGFVEYERLSQTGLLNQGWKDSDDSVFHSDGSLAQAPIALCEVQAYVYAAKMQAANMAFLLRKDQQGKKWLEQAQILKKKFLQAFWSEDIETFVIALDGKKQPCQVATSNAGQCLFSGIATKEYAEKTARLLTSAPFFSGWGIRTVPTNAARYNPMSYHNGTIWPHDNALIAYGFSKYNRQEEAKKVLTRIFEAAMHVELYRLPELYCGFKKEHAQGPTLYPVACSPQSWASGSPLLLLQSCLGLEIHAPENKLNFNHPVLPDFLDKVWIRNLTIGTNIVDLEIERHEQNVGVNVLKRYGDVEIRIVK